VSTDLPLILIEGVLVFGGALAFGWWQLRSLERDRQALLRRREEEARRVAGGAASDAARAEQDGMRIKDVNHD
jgi:hypothetical protein